MPETDPPPRHGTPPWKYALLGGLLALPFTTLGYRQTGSELSLGAVSFGGLLAGYLVKRAGGESSGVGTRVGLVGGLPVLWVLFDVLAAATGLDGPAWFVTSATLLTVGFTIVVTVLGFGIAALVGAIASLPVTVLVNRTPNSGATVSGSITIVGGFLAGVVGVSTFVVTVVGDSLGGSTVAWPLFRVVFFVFAGVLFLFVASVFGLVCGRVGGWMADTLVSLSRAGTDE